MHELWFPDIHFLESLEELFEVNAVYPSLHIKRNDGSRAEMLSGFAGQAV